MLRGRPQTWLVAAWACACACGPARDGDAVARVRAAGVLRWGGDMQGGDPYVFSDPERPGALIGFEVEIAEGLARRLGVRAEFAQNDWYHLIPSIERGGFDIILNGLEATPDRAERILLSRPYYIFREKLLVRRDSAIGGLGDLGGRRVGTLQGTTAELILRRTPGVEVVLYEGVEEPYSDLEHGRTDAVLMDDLIADRFGVPRPTLKAVGGVIDTGTYVAGVRKSEPELRAAIDAAIGTMIADGELRRILEKWRLWDDGQLRLAELRSPTPAAAAPRRVLTLDHVALFLRGAGITIVISVAAMALAIAAGLGLSLLRMYGPAAGRALAVGYVEVIRGTPVLLQLYVLYYGIAEYVNLGPFAAAVLGLGLNYAAYEAEIYRAGLLSVPRGQSEAALALGMSQGLALRRIVLPQALRVAIPGVTNDFIALLKDSSLVSVITVVELTKQMTITAVELRGWMIPGALCALLYFLMSYPLSRLAQRLERKLGPAPR